MTIQELADSVAQATGLKPTTVADQLLAEQGASASGPYSPVPTNPFNLGPNIQYGSVAQGLAAYENLINTSPNYAVLRSDRGASAVTQLEDLAASPFDSGHYTVPGGSLGSKLYQDYGTAATLVGASPNPGLTAAQFASGVQAAGEVQGAATGGPAAPPSVSEPNAGTVAGGAVTSVTQWLSNESSYISSHASTWLFTAVGIVLALIAILVIFGVI